MANLGLSCSIAWWGVSGLRWAFFRRSIEAKVLLCTPLQIIVLHLGRNDITSSTSTKLCRNIASEISYLREAFPLVLIIWVNILGRLKWDDSYSKKAIEKKRKPANHFGRRCVRSTGTHDIITIDITTGTPGLFSPDSIHLSDVGLEFYLDTLKDALAKHMTT
ncbi:hypothetical protein DPMN_035684 [Dreissena polymorpha]|uniref:SGNH hydrolase-type esterase domain-containing protein n=1 Tax=Dreissena polymorpha TaxID=45954 RepID=A0A9D4M999_DREPO|nr:hypothetical protein DPMN_035684 [Dreissena polymorpha]